MEVFNDFSGGISANEFSQLMRISERVSNPDEFLENSDVQELLKKIFSRGKYEESFPYLIRALINSRKDFDDAMRDNLIDFFSEPPKLSIRSYRNYLRFKGSREWDISNSDDYHGLSQRIMNHLTTNELEKTVEAYGQRIKEIAEVTSTPQDTIVSLLKKYKMACDASDMSAFSAASGSIKGLFKKFNSKAKSKFIEDYNEKNVNSIKDRFECVGSKEAVDGGISSDAVYVLLGSQRFRNTIRNFVKNSFGVLLEPKELSDFVVNALYRNDDENKRLLGISISPKVSLLQATRSFNRLNQNFMPAFKTLFNVSMEQLVNDYICSDDITYRKSLEKNFTSLQKGYLNTMRPILKEASAKVIVKNGEFCLSSNVPILDSFDETSAKIQRRLYNGYIKIVNMIFKAYEASRNVVGNIGDSVAASQTGELPFTDDNYVLTNWDYLTRLDQFAKIINLIDTEDLAKIFKDRESINSLRKLLFDEGLISCLICDSADVSVIAKLINRLPQINKDSVANDFSTNNLLSIFKRADLCQYIDDFTLALLGEDVAEKIVYNFQFLQGKNTPKQIAERLHKARYLMINAEGIDTSAIPYFEPITCDGLSINRYRNNDSKILTSGIDSNTCFKIGANDNDYLFYSILNQNGMVAYFEENGKLCGRITAHRRNNCLLINGIRNIDNSYEATSIEQKEQNDKIIAVVSAFAKKMIEVTTDSDCPIDFVIANKSGILESSDYDGVFAPAYNDCFLKYVDTYSDDFYEFQKIAESDSTLLSQVAGYRQGDGEPFTTDFGHYSLAMLASRPGKFLDSPRDISYITPESIYNRNHQEPVIGSGVISRDLLNRMRKIHALAYYYDGKDPADYTMPVFKPYYDSFEISDTGYTLVVDGEVNSVGYNIEKAKVYKKAPIQQNPTAE